MRVKRIIEIDSEEKKEEKILAEIEKTVPKFSAMRKLFANENHYIGIVERLTLANNTDLFQEGSVILIETNAVPNEGDIIIDHQNLIRQFTEDIKGAMLRYATNNKDDVWGIIRLVITQPKREIIELVSNMEK